MDLAALIFVNIRSDYQEFANRSFNAPKRLKSLAFSHKEAFPGANFVALSPYGIGKRS